MILERPLYVFHPPPVILYCLEFLKAFATVFSISQRVRLLVFIMYSLFLDKGPHSVVRKGKMESTSELFQRNLHNA